MEDQDNMEKQTVEQPYEKGLLDNIKRILEIQVSQGKPQSYEIYVDGLRVVPRTTVTEIFDSYQTFLSPASKKIIVTIYRGIKTPACTSHVFTVEPEKVIVQQPVQVQSSNALNGPEVQQYVRELMDKERLANRLVQLEEKLSERENKLAEAEKYISDLQRGIDLLKEEKDNKQSVIFDRLLKIAENPPDWLKLLVLNNNSPQKATQLGETETKDKTEVTIKKKTAPALSEDEKDFLKLMNIMQEGLEEEEFTMLMLINRKLTDEPALITEVGDLVDVKL
ncbi:MAG: hypothetical protein IT233_12600 [Bacteroidia bacterium]|nr:hypothetical protein [Bacteroidia bacterium]